MPPANRRPPLEPPAEPQAVPPTRRVGGARRETGERVVLLRDGREIAGWGLNVSRRGVRAIVEEPVEAGAELDVIVGSAAPRRGRVVWVQEEPDGAIVGLELDRLDGG